MSLPQPSFAAMFFLPQKAPGARRYGKLIYLLLGDRAELSFALTWLQGLAVENAAALKDVASTAAQTILSALVLEQLAFNRSRWFFSHLDYLSVQVRLPRLPRACPRQPPRAMDEGLSPEVCSLLSSVRLLPLSCDIVFAGHHVRARSRGSVSGRVGSSFASPHPALYIFERGRLTI